MTRRRSDLKTCFKCGESKRRTEFYRHPQMGDGLLGKCKTCARADVKANREARLDYYRQYDKERGHPSERTTPEKRAARVAVRQALSTGRLVKPLTCEDCGTQPPLARSLHAHHEDYSKPLDVIWVCVKCHGLRHGSDALSHLHQVIHFRFPEEEVA